MPPPRHELGLVSRLNASAIGVPGKRRFQVTAEGPGGSVLIWLGKEQLQALAMSIHRVLATQREQKGAPAAPPAPRAQGAPQNLDFVAGGLALEFDRRGLIFGISAQEQDAATQAPLLVRLWATREQAAHLAEEALEVCAAGRPLCPLCLAPLDEGLQHVCPRSNGHPRL